MAKRFFSTVNMGNTFLYLLFYHLVLLPEHSRELRLVEREMGM